MEHPHLQGCGHVRQPECVHAPRLQQGRQGPQGHDAGTDPVGDELELERDVEHFHGHDEGDIRRRQGPLEHGPIATA